MEKRHQVFVSSTYRNLELERQSVIQALLELDCIPAGMELFPASDDDQWTLIKRVIDDCDYYIVIIAGRYGSNGPDGIGYTEKEYDYAVQIGKPIIAFFHESPESIPLDKSEKEPLLRDKLAAFTEKAKRKVAKLWKNAEDLSGKVSRSLVQLKKTHPAEGWVKARYASSPEETLRLRSQIDELTARLNSLTTVAPEGTETLSQGADVVTIEYREHHQVYDDDILNRTLLTNWDEVFGLIGPLMFEEADEIRMMSAIGEHITFRQAPADSYTVCLPTASFQLLKVQFVALGLITLSDRKRGVHDKGTYWKLTPYGVNYVMKLMAQKRPESQSNSGGCG